MRIIKIQLIFQKDEIGDGISFKIRSVYIVFLNLKVSIHYYFVQYQTSCGNNPIRQIIIITLQCGNRSLHLSFHERNLMKMIKRQPERLLLPKTLTQG